MNSPDSKTESTSLDADGNKSATVKTNFTGTMLQISVGSQEVWLTRDEAMSVCDALPNAISRMPVKI